MAAWQLIDRYLTDKGIAVPRPGPGQTVRMCKSGSWHCEGMGARARDYGLGGDVAGESRIALALEPLAASGQLVELYHTPTGIFYKNGARITPSKSLADEHKDHVHAAVAPGVTALTGGPGPVPGAGAVPAATAGGGSLAAAASGIEAFLDNADDPTFWKRAGAFVLGLLLLLGGALVTFAGLSGARQVASAAIPSPKGAPA